MSSMNEMDQLENVSVKRTTISVPFKDAKVDQAQIQLPVQEMKSINNIPGHVKLKNRFKVKQGDDKRIWLCGCTMLQNGNLLIVDHYGMNIKEYSEEGNHIRDIPCSFKPYGLTVIDNDHIAVTYPMHGRIEILNIKDNTVERKAKVDERCFGISYQDNKLFISASNGIVITDIAGKILETLPIDCGLFMTTRDRIYYNAGRDHTVHCISMTGETVWVYEGGSLFEPRGITVDNHQNVFVADRKSNSVIAIQHDGRSSKTILSETDGLNAPFALHFNKNNNTLLLCNKQGPAALYNVE